MDRAEIADWFRGLQDNICNALEQADGVAKFQEDHWERPGGGGGRTRVLKDGAVIEKGGVNFSAVEGSLPDKIAEAVGVDAAEFFATGVSIVQHPQSPLVPIIHMNVRYFEMDDGTYWFGGGIDLTPHYVVEGDARWFHEQIKEVCDRFDPHYYPDFKKWADDYFFIKHRDETRGVGGIFFDRLVGDDEHTPEQRWKFVQAVGEAFAPIYVELINRNRDKKYTEKEKEWQLLRRGRYVEFNLVYDKGTKFGLDTSGRIESILMSLPKQVSWFYDHQPKQGSKEAKTLSWLKKDIDWVN